MAGKKLGQVEYITAAAESRQYPATTLPEFAIIGRSNVGKSSLINVLTGRKNIARISKTPGKTRLLHFYDVGGNFIIVDLPGYGFARVSDAERNKWDKMANDYLIQRDQLCFVVLLIDARLGPTKLDTQMAEWLHINHIPWFGVLTKADKISKSALAGTISRSQKAFPYPIVCSDILPFSSKTGQGKRELMKRLFDSARQFPASQEE